MTSGAPDVEDSVKDDKEDEEVLKMDSDSNSCFYFVGVKVG